MAVTIRETGKSRNYSAKRSDNGGERSITIRYWAYGSDDPLVIEQAFLDEVSETYDGMLLDSYSIDVMNDKGDNWEAEFTYNSTRLEDGSFEWSIDTGGATVKVTQAYDYADFGTSSFDSQGAINIDAQGRSEGIDLGIPQLTLNCRARIPGDFVTLGYIQVLKGLSYKMNDGDFFGFASGEILFLGAQVTVVLGESTDINFKFTASENVTGLTIGGVSGIEKLGHDYLWIRYKDSEGADGIERTVDTVSVDRVYQFGNLNLLKIGDFV